MAAETTAPVVEKPATAAAPAPVAPTANTSITKEQHRTAPSKVDPGPLAQEVSRRQPTRRPSLGDTIAAAEKKTKEVTTPEKKPDAEPEKKPESAAATVPAAEPEKKDEPKKSTRARLTGSLEQAEPKPAAEPEKKPDEEVADELPTDTEMMRKRISKIKGETARERAAREAAETKARTLEQRIAELESKSSLTEAQQKEQQAKEDELLRLRRRFDLESDPEVKKFDTRIEAARKTVDSAIDRLPSTLQWVKDEIKAVGGLDALARSTKTYAIKAPTDDDPNARADITGAELYRRVLALMDPVDADTARVAIAEQRRIAEEKKGYVDAESTKAREYFDKQAATRAEEEKATNERRTEIEKLVRGLQEGGPKKLAWLQDVAIPADPEGAKAAQATNRERETIRQLWSEVTSSPAIVAAAMSATSKEELDEIGRMVMDSVRVFSVESELRAARQEIKRLTQQIDDIKGASRTIPRSGAGDSVPATTKAPELPEIRPGETMMSFSIRMQTEKVPEDVRTKAMLAAQRRLRSA